jgi:hypothetical protein
LFSTRLLLWLGLVVVDEGGVPSAGFVEAVLSGVESMEVEEVDTIKPQEEEERQHPMTSDLVTTFSKVETVDSVPAASIRTT